MAVVRFFSLGFLVFRHFFTLESDLFAIIAVVIFGVFVTSIGLASSGGSLKAL